MADTVQFDLVSPERLLASAQVTAVRIPGADGDMTAMAGHAPTITTLRPGLLITEGPDGASEYVVTGGFAEISARGISVLAERAIPKGEVTKADHDAMVKEAEEAHAKAKAAFENEPGPVDDAAKLLADMVAIGDHISI
jgi:F-type H+-transporting ATPase subunit epsilon